MRSVTETQSAVQMLVGGHGAASESASPLDWLDLQSQVLKANGVVAVHRALELQREDALEIALGARHKSTAGLGRRDLEAAIELGHIAFPQEAIGLWQGGVSRQSQFLGQASLPSSEVTLAAAARL